jgi:hypothetical protein
MMAKRKKPKPAALPNEPRTSREHVADEIGQALIAIRDAQQGLCQAIADVHFEAQKETSTAAEFTLGVLLKVNARMVEAKDMCDLAFERVAGQAKAKAL